MTGSTLAARFGAYAKKKWSGVWAIVAAQQVSFLVCFTVLAAYTARIHALYPLSFGQDFHYHLMNAAMGARSTDEPVRTLYHWISPFDSNTLLYTIAYPFEKLTHSPARAFQIACTIAYWIGYPLGCAYALIRCGRSPWGALLAFPLSYGITSTTGGFWPFLTGSALLAPALAEMLILHRTRGKQAFQAGVRCAVFSSLVFLAHGIVFCWLCTMMALHTLVMMAWGTGINGAFAPWQGLRRALRVGMKSLAVIAPSVVLAARWYYHVTWGSASAARPLPLAPPVDPTISDKFHKMLDALAPTTAEHEYWYLGTLGLLCLAALIFADRKSDALGPGILERSFLVSAISFVVLPYWAFYEPIAPRQFDIAVLLFPVVLFPRRPRMRSATGVVLLACFAFALARLSLISEQLRILNEVDYAGLLKTAEACRRLVPHDRVVKVAYANDNIWTKSFHAGGLQQSQETFAAVCGIETPVYDTQIGPHNVLPLRYVGAISAPVTFLSTTGWYNYPGLFKNFEYVLVRDWHMSKADSIALAPKAELVAKYGVYELWKGK